MKPAVTFISLLFLLSNAALSQNLQIQPIRSDIYHGESSYAPFYVCDAMPMGNEIVFSGNNFNHLIITKINHDHTPVWSMELDHPLLQNNLKIARNLSLVTDSQFVFSIDASNLMEDTSLLVCMNTSGEVLWSQKLFQDSKVLIHDIHVTSDHNIFCLAELYASTEFMIIQFDRNGNTLQSKNYDVNEWAMLSPLKIVTDDYENLFVSGLMYQNEVHGFFIKIDATGLPVFQRTYDLNSQYGIDGFSFEQYEDGFLFLFYYDSKFATCRADSTGYITTDLKETASEFYSNIKLTDFQRINDTLFLAQNQMSYFEEFTASSGIPSVCIFNPDKAYYHNIGFLGDHIKTIVSSDRVLSSFVEGPELLISKNETPHAGVTSYTIEEGSAVNFFCLEANTVQYPVTTSIFQTEDSSYTVTDVVCDQDIYIDFQPTTLSKDTGCIQFTAIEEIDEHAHYHLNPNPAEDFVQIEGLSGGEVIRIYDLLGKMISEKVLNPDSKILDLHRLNPGIYTVQIQLQKDRKSLLLIKQ